MSIDSETFARYAKAEKELCDRVRMLLAGAIESIEAEYAISIAEFRVTMDRSLHNRWSCANCVLVRAAQSDGDEKKPAATACAHPELGERAAD